LQGNPFQGLMYASMDRYGTAIYPDSEKKFSKFSRKIQVTEGQMMGHPLSFPLLCWINLAVYRTAVKRYFQPKIAELKDLYVESAKLYWESQKSSGYCTAANKGRGGNYKHLSRSGLSLEEILDSDPNIRICYNLRNLRLKDLEAMKEREERMINNVIVNGDDMLFKCPKDFMAVFEPTAKEVGLKLSVGKNYLSNHSCMINSQMFQRHGGLMTRRGYLNLKIVKGTSLKTGHSNALPTQIGRELNQMVKHCPWTASAVPAAMFRFQKHEQKFGSSFRPNWYLPVHLGGYGLNRALGPSEIVFTRSQRKVAACFAADPRLVLMRRKSVPMPYKGVADSMTKWTMIPASAMDVPNNPRLEEDPWMNKLTTAVRMSHAVAEEDDRIFLAKISKMRHFKPMSADGIERWSLVHLLPTVVPICPPCDPIDCRKFLAKIDLQVEQLKQPLLETGLGVPKGTFEHMFSPHLAACMSYVDNQSTHYRFTSNLPYLEDAEQFKVKPEELVSMPRAKTPSHPDFWKAINTVFDRLGITDSSEEEIVEEFGIPDADGIPEY